MTATAYAMSARVSGMRDALDRQRTWIATAQAALADLGKLASDVG
jgi:hypothetical protein